MAKVRAKEACYLGDAGYRTPDDGEFEYNGPQHDSLEYAGSAEDDERDDADTKYHALTRDELKAELEKRGISYAANAGEKNLREKLEADDAR